MQCYTLSIWAHVFGYSNSLVLDNESFSAIRNRLHSQRLTKEQLASFHESSNWEALYI